MESRIWNLMKIEIEKTIREEKKSRSIEGSYWLTWIEEGEFWENHGGEKSKKYKTILCTKGNKCPTQDWHKNPIQVESL